MKFNVDDVPEIPELHASRQNLETVLKPQYWQQLCPTLHVADAKFFRSLVPFQLAKGRLNDLKHQINYAGVAQVDSHELPWSVKQDELAAAVARLLRHGWPASMLVAYDEVWALIQQASKMMRKASGGNTCNMDILCWYVDPNRGDAGFSPHRDRQPDHSPDTFRADGSAMYTTLWTPLTPATPDNSCLYVLPRFADPGYFEGDPEDDEAPDPLTAALPTKEAYQHIRALPAAPGAAVIFTHRIIHWGSRGRVGAAVPRISLSWGCADDAFEPPYFSRQHLPCPTLEMRLALIGAQMIIYHQRFPAAPQQLALYYQLFSAHAAQFDSSYRSKVIREFVDASKEATAGAAGTAVRSSGTADGAGKAGGGAAAAAGGPAAAALNEVDGAGAAAESRRVSNGNKAKIKRSKMKSEGRAALPEAIAAADLVGQLQGQQRHAAAAGFAAEDGKKRKKHSKHAAAEQEQAEAQEQQQQQQREHVSVAPTKDHSSQQSKKCKTAAVVEAFNSLEKQQQQQSLSKQQLRRQKQKAKKRMAAATAQHQAQAGQPPSTKLPAATDPPPTSTKSTKRNRKKQKTLGKAATTALGTDAATAEDEDRDGEAIDWAALLAAATVKAAKRKAKRKGNQGRGSSLWGVGDDAFDEVGDDVLDMALEGMLDAQLAGEDFADDFVEDQA